MGKEGIINFIGNKSVLPIIGFAVLSFCVAMYSAFSSNFAELHIGFSFLPVPLFVGELLLATCILLYLIDKYVLGSNVFPAKFSRTVYVCFFIVCLVAVIGYFKWSALAFRHAAMFYYPLFAYLTYYFLSRITFKQNVAYVLYGIGLFGVSYFKTYWLFYYVMLIVISLLFMPRKRQTVLLLILASLAIPYSRFIYTSRMFIVGNIAAFVFLLTMLICMWQVSLKRKIILLITGLLVIAVGLSFNVESVKSIVAFDHMYESIKKREQMVEEIRQKQGGLEFKPYEVKLYHQNRANHLKRYFQDDIYEEDKWSGVTIPIGFEGVYGGEKFDESGLEFVQHFKGTVEGTYNTRTVKKNMANGTIRLLIWKDLLKEVVNEKAVFGFGLGKPTRSITIETLNNIKTDWMRDGWVSPHSSYVHITYRLGVLGIAIAGFFFYYVLKIIRVFLRNQNIIGIILVSIIVNWSAAAFFLSIFELPHNVIPLWFIYGGVLYLHRRDLDKEKSIVQ